VDLHGPDGVVLDGGHDEVLCDLAGPERQIPLQEHGGEFFRTDHCESPFIFIIPANIPILNRAPRFFFDALRPEVCYCTARNGESCMRNFLLITTMAVTLASCQTSDERQKSGYLAAEVRGYAIYKETGIAGLMYEVDKCYSDLRRYPHEFSDIEPCYFLDLYGMYIDHSVGRAMGFEPTITADAVQNRFRKAYVAAHLDVEDADETGAVLREAMFKVLRSRE
jgi:hypothetical protein